MKKKLPLSVFEIIAYVVLGLLGLWALTYIVLGVICDFIYHKSALAEANAKLNLGFLWEGLIILGVTAVVSVTLLLITAKKSDRDFERTQRRAARLKKAPTVNPEVVDAEVAPVEQKE